MYLVYFVLWLIFNANITWEIAIIGLIAAGAIFAFTCKFADYSIQKEKKLYCSFFQIVKYLIKLVAEVVKSNLAVMNLIVSQKEEIQPLLVSFETKLQKPTMQALMANTITLTPGTITVLLEDGIYTVHCLDESFAEGIEQSDFVELIKKIEEQ